MKGMTIEALVKACGGKLCGGGAAADAEASCVVIDSRKIEPLGVFVATKGERVDGHSFIPQVFEAGALAVVCEELPADPAGPCILVEDSFKALTAIAGFYRAQLDTKIIGVTGSVGKTTTKEQTASVLRQKYRVCATEGNLNNEIGVPLTLLRIRPEDEIAVVEMGINHFGEMSRLTKLVRPDMAVITAIGECNLEALGDLDGVLRAKSEIFEGMAEDAPVFLNAEDAKLKTVQRKNIIWFNDGYSDRLAAEAVGHYLGLSDDEIREGLEKIQPLPGRGRLVRCPEYTVIDDCYNANPTSMRYSLDRLCRTAAEKRVAILGDMFELGENEEALHAAVGDYVREKGVERLITAGKLSENMKAPEHYASTEELLKALPGLKLSGSTILVKASHGMHFEKIVEVLEHGI